MARRSVTAVARLFKVRASSKVAFAIKRSALALVKSACFMARVARASRSSILNKAAPALTLSPTLTFKVFTMPGKGVPISIFLLWASTMPEPAIKLL